MSFPRELRIKIHTVNAVLKCALWGQTILLVGFLNPCSTTSPVSFSAQICLLLRNRGFHGRDANLEEIPVGTLPLDAYNELVKAGAIKQDPNQIAALQPLERLHQELEHYTPSAPGFTSKLFSSIIRQKETPRGVYIYGGVGSGKSLVADIFFHCSPVKSKRRVHFHQFMLDVHKRLHQRETMSGNKAEKRDLIETVAEDLLKAGWLISFDEFQVLDIADAIILKRLLECLFRAGAVMVASSNRAPSELYKNGLQRELFLPCIELIRQRCHIHLFRPDAPDYRLIGARPDGKGALSTVWHMPLNKDTRQKLEKSFAELAGNRVVGPTVLKEGSRRILVPRAAGGIAFFSFDELCGTPKGAADYVAIASSFHTLFISDIPRMTRSHGELARRFITLVDILYEQRVKLIVSADADPGLLYLPRVEEEQVGPVGAPKDDNRLGSTSSYEEKDEEFAYARTVSRLNHMQTADYLSAPWAPPGKAFIVHLESVRLQEGDLRRIWDRYNLDSDSTLSRDELLLMMQDLTEIKSGHRNVPKVLLDDMYEKLDANHDGVVVWEEFRDYFLQYGLQVQ
ncbi:unnamed protein product [Calypogeia fissa]